MQVDPMPSNSGFVHGFIMRPLQYTLYIISSPETHELNIKNTRWIFWEMLHR